MRPEPWRPILLASAAALLSIAPAQAEPFFEDMIRQSQGFGLEMVGVRLSAIEAFDPVPAGLDEVSEGFSEADLPRFMGTLRHLHPAVAEGLEEALAAVEEGVEEGEVGLLTLAYARAWQAAAYDVLIPADARTPAYWGAIAADLALAEGGVAEAIEETVEEGDVWAYPTGWAALQRMTWIWERLTPLASEDELSYGRQYLDILHALLPTARVPATLTVYPEEAEGPAQSLVGVFESVTDASLYTGRDVGRLAEHLAELTVPACELYAAGEVERATEVTVAIAPHYRNHLADLLDLVAPEVHAVAGGILDELVEVGDERPADLAAACGELHDALLDARTALGG